MITHDLGPLYLARYSVESGAPLLRRTTTRSYQRPYRWARAIVFRYWPGWAVEVGWWRKPINRFEDDVDSLTRAIQGKLLVTSWQGQHLEIGKTHEFLEQVHQEPYRQ